MCSDIYQNLSINKSTKGITKFFFSKNSNCDLDLGLAMLKCNCLQNIVILNICVKLYQNQFTNKGIRMMRKFFQK